MGNDNDLKELEEENDSLLILHTRKYDKKVRDHPPLFITLVLNDLYLHNFMLDSRDSTNVMTLKIIKNLD
jgi:hypothetical protein